MSKIFLFRHAQASAGARVYDKLSDKGRKQAAILGDYIHKKGWNFDHVFSGPLERQVDTCTLAAAQCDAASFPDYNLVDGLREHHGFRAMMKAMPDLVAGNAQIREWTLESNAYPSLARRNGMRIFKYFMEEWTNDRIQVEDMQSWQDFKIQVAGAVQTIKSKVAKGETAAVFTSGGTISAIVAEALGIADNGKIASLNYAIRNTSLTTFFYTPKEFNLQSFNEVPHLPEEMITFV